MSEVIDAQVVDGQATGAGEVITAPERASDPLADLLATPQKAEIVATDEGELSPEDQAQVEKFMSQIDIKDSQLVLQYGAAAQKNVAEFSEGALNSVKTKDMGEIGSMLTGVVTELKGFSAE